jgi:hypothetical protein
MAVWTAWRKAIHEGLFQSPISTFDFVKGFLNDLGEVHHGVVKKQGPRLFQHWARWSPPSPGVIKCNVDAVVSRLLDHGAVGVVCRDSTGRFVGASSRTIKGVSDLEYTGAITRFGTDKSDGFIRCRAVIR